MERSTRRSASVWRGRLGRPGVDDVDVAALADEELLAVGRELEIADVLHDRFGLDVAVPDLDGLELGLARGVRSLVDEEQGLLAGGEPGVDARRERDLEDARLEAGELDGDLDRGGRLLRLLGRLPGARLGFGLGRLFLSALFLVRLELRSRGEGEGVLAAQPGGVDLGRLVEVGLGLARSPGAAHGAPEPAVGQEVEPLPVGAPGGIVGIDAVVRQLGRPPRFGLAEDDPAEPVRGALDVGEPAAVGGPGQVAEHADVGDADAGQGLLRDVVDPELIVLVGEGQPFAVGRGDAVEADDLGPGRHLFGRAQAVRGEAVEFPLAGRVVEDHQALAVAHEPGRPGPDALLAADPDPAAVADGRDEDVAAGDEDDAVAARGDVARGQVVEGLRHPALAHLIEVRGQGDGQVGVLVRGDVVDMDVGHELVGDAPGVEARGAGVEALVEGVLA